MEQRHLPFWEHGRLYLTRGGSLVQTFMSTDKQIIGAYFDEKNELWVPTSWTPEGFFVDKSVPRPLDLTTKEYEI